MLFCATLMAIKAQLGALQGRGSSSACLTDVTQPGHIMKSLVHCSMVSVGLVTVWPTVFGDEKISKSLPPCARTRLSSCHAAGIVCETHHVAPCFALCSCESRACQPTYGSAMQPMTGKHFSHGTSSEFPNTSPLAVRAPCCASGQARALVEGLLMHLTHGRRAPRGGRAHLEGLVAEEVDLAVLLLDELQAVRLVPALPARQGA